MNPAQPEPTAIEHFSRKLRFELDPADLVIERMSATPPFVIDTRSTAAWNQGHVPGACHIPGNDIAVLAPNEVPELSTPIVVYCWGPGCNGSTKAALALVRLGYTDVREMIGGFEYWAREGLAIESARGRCRRPVDALTGIAIK